MPDSKIQKKYRIRYYTNIAPHYRKNLWELLLTDLDLDIDIFFGKSSKKHGIKEIDLSDGIFKVKTKKLHGLINFRLFNLLVYQFGTIFDSLFHKPDAAIFLGQAYILSNWISAVIYRIKRVKVIFWGHGLYGNESVIKKLLNLYFIKLSDIYLTYNNYSKNILIDNNVNPGKIFVIYNSVKYTEIYDSREKCILLSKSENLPFFKNPNNYLLIFIGRLTPEKKIHLLIKSLQILNDNEMKYNLLIIGDGSEKKSLEENANHGLEENFIHFYGDLYDEYEIGKYLSLSDLCVSPGNVGLTAIHSLSYGTPVATHNNFTSQMPEFEAIEEGKTGFFFKENDVNDLADKIKKWSVKYENKNEIRNNCYKIVDEKYNPCYQITVLKNCLNHSE